MAACTAQEIIKFDTIVFGNNHIRALEQVAALTFEENIKLKRIMDQKIAFISGYKPSRAQVAYQQAAEETSYTPNFFGTVCCFLFPESNRDVFDITDEIFIKRFFSVFLFWKKGFISVGGPKSDIYGPVWLSFLYVTIVGLSANLNMYFNDLMNFHTIETFYAQVIGLLLIFTVLEFFIYPMVVGCFNGAITPNESISLLGYSLVLYYIPTILCSFPSLMWHMTMLAVGGFLRTVFLFRNYGAKIDSSGLGLLIVIAVFEFGYFYFAFQSLFRTQSGYSFSDGINQVFYAGLTQVPTPGAHKFLRVHSDCFDY